MNLIKADNNIYAILGPTNTGKTYLAFDRIIGYSSGIFGFPLRLLARENYDKAIKVLGVEKVALITGEEKIYPKGAKYFFCTVESMPVNIEVECIAIDEIQLASDYERGHIFTDKILNARGTLETIFLGSDTIEKILIKLFPKIKIEKRDRYSKLSFAKKQSISKLKPRSAIIAFNISKVYEIAEMMRTYKGGSAVVLGSLSPRTRNAQVDIYENKKVEYLVATDAIGMGLNLNIDHVSFSSFQKFDGRFNRNLYPAEIGQIAGRAGRFMNDGTFGYTQGADTIDPLIIKSVEDHNFDLTEKIYWRNSKIDFSTVTSVINSLKKFPIKKFFIHKKNAEDEINFKFLSSDQDILKFLNNEKHIKLLWDVCRIPDFQKIMNDSYLALLKEIFLSLINHESKISESLLSDRIIPLDNYAGGIDELTYKIANIRTWTYISNQSLWLENNDYWKEKTRNIEDNLSDKLHESLTNRFIDFSASVLFDNQKEGKKLEINVDSNNSINLSGQKYGYINGFNLKLISKSTSNSLFFLNHVKKSIRIMIEEKLNNFINAPDEAINLGDVNKMSLEDSVYIYWGDEKIAFLIKGENIYRPKIKVINSEFLSSDNKLKINNKLQKWIDKHISIILKPINDTLDDSTSSNVRSLTFNLYNNLGTMRIQDFSNEIKQFSIEDKSTISKLGIRIGAKFFFMPNFLKKKSMELNSRLWKVFTDTNKKNSYPLPNDGRVSFVSELEMPESYWNSIGYIINDFFAVRVDVFERIFFLARQKIKKGPFLESSDLMNPIGCNSDQLEKILIYCGFDSCSVGDGKKLFLNKQNNKHQVKKLVNKDKKENVKKLNKKFNKRQKSKLDPDSPFAVLQKLL